MSRTIAIGDIHGCAKTFIHLVYDMLQPTAKDHLILLGDYVNKGPDSRGVIDYILQLKSEGLQVDCIRGNHDQLMLDAWKDDKLFQEFLDRGGDTTLASFGCDQMAEIPTSYYSFLATTSFFIETDKFYLMHAGFNFEAPDIFFDFDAMLNIREMDVDLNKTNGKRLVHGHVPVEMGFLQGELKKEWNEISIDTGCPYTDQYDKGFLTAMILETEEIIYVKNQEG